MEVNDKVIGHEGGTKEREVVVRIGRGRKGKEERKGRGWMGKRDFTRWKGACGEGEWRRGRRLVGKENGGGEGKSVCV